jgi:hypothetical protein
MGVHAIAARRAAILTTLTLVLVAVGLAPAAADEPPPILTGQFNNIGATADASTYACEGPGGAATVDIDTDGHFGNAAYAGQPSSRTTGSLRFTASPGYPNRGSMTSANLHLSGNWFNVYVGIGTTLVEADLNYDPNSAETPFTLDCYRDPATGRLMSVRAIGVPLRYDAVLSNNTGRYRDSGTASAVVIYLYESETGRVSQQVSFDFRDSDSATPTPLFGAPASVSLTPDSQAITADEYACVEARAVDADDTVLGYIPLRMSAAGVNTGTAWTDLQRTSVQYPAMWCPLTRDPGQLVLTVYIDANEDGVQQASELSDTATITVTPGAVRTLTAAPTGTTSPVATEHCVDVTATDAWTNPVPAANVSVRVFGANPEAAVTRVTGVGGRTKFCYTGTNTGVDYIEGVFLASPTARAITGSATHTWTAPDTTAPVLTLSHPPVGHTVTFGGPAGILAFSCQDATDPHPTCAATVDGAPAASGSTLPATLGTHSVTLTSTDAAGNTSGMTRSFEVKYAFGGLTGSVSSTEVNVAKAGSVAPFQFRLTDAAGNPITNLSTVSVASRQVNCASLDGPLDAVEETAVGGSGLRNLGDGRYQWNWATSKSYAGTCRIADVLLGPGGVGGTASAPFKFAR